MTHPYRDVPQEISEQHVWLVVYTQWLDKHALRDDVNFTWIQYSAADAARAAVIAFREMHREARVE